MFYQNGNVFLSLCRGCRGSASGSYLGHCVSRRKGKNKRHLISSKVVQLHQTKRDDHGFDITSGHSSSHSQTSGAKCDTDLGTKFKECTTEGAGSSPGSCGSDCVPYITAVPYLVDDVGRKVSKHYKAIFPFFKHCG